MVVLVKGPVAVADDRIIAEQAHAYLVIGKTRVATQTVTGLPLYVLLIEHEVQSRSLYASLDIHLGKLVPCARAVTHVSVECEIFVIQLIGVDGYGVYIVLSVADAQGSPVKVKACVTAHLTTDVAEVHLVLLQVTLHNTVGTHVHVKVELGHGGLEAFDVNPTLTELALNLIGRILEVFKQRHHVLRRVQMRIVVLVFYSDTGYPRSTMKRGMGIIGDKQTAVQLPINVVKCDIGIPTLRAQVDIALGM